MNKSEKIALCLYCKRKVEKYSDLMILGHLKSDKTPCMYCNSFDDIDIYRVTKKNKIEAKTNIIKLCLHCHNRLNKKIGTKTELLEWHGKLCTCEICNETSTGGTYKITTK